MRVLIFSGTSDGNELISKLKRMYHVEITVSVATEYGKSFVDDRDVDVMAGRLNTSQIQACIENKNIDVVVDATHPYATEVSENIVVACENMQCRYLRLLRDVSVYSDDVILANSIKWACEVVRDGNVLATTGSKQIAEFVEIDDYRNRLYARVLPTPDSVQLCYDIGLNDSHIIQNLGAVSVEENVATIRKLNIKTLITKDGGIKGGFPQKCEACRLTETLLIVISRPDENGFGTGFDVEQIVKIIGDGFGDD